MNVTEQQAAPAVKIVLSTAPPGEAPALARRLVEERLVACANLVAGVRSVYRWREEVEESDETLLVLKTDASRAGALARRIQELHSYDCPEVVVLPVESGLAGYLEWVVGCVREDEGTAQ